MFHFWNQGYAVFEFGTAGAADNTNWYPRLLRVRSRRGKGRGSVSNLHSQESVDPGHLGSSWPPSACGMTHDNNNLDVAMASADVSSVTMDMTKSAATGSLRSDCATNSTTLVLESRLRKRICTAASNSTTTTTTTSVSANSNGSGFSLTVGSGSGDSKPPTAYTTVSGANEAAGADSAHPASALSRYGWSNIVGAGDPAFEAECAFLEEVEGLEDRVLSSSLQVKGWQAPIKALDDETVHLIPRSTPKRSRFEHWPSDLACSRLLELESHLERRYLLPPLNSIVHLDVVPEPGTDTMSMGESRDDETAETGSESGLGYTGSTTVPTSDSVSVTSGKDCEVGAGANQPAHAPPQIRRVMVANASHSSATEGVNSVSGGGGLASSTAAIQSPSHSGYPHHHHVPETSANYLLTGWSTDSGLPAGLLEWRNRLRRATELAAMRACMDELAQAIAWDKSIMKVLCQICRRDNNEAQLLLCDGCDHGYHTYCFRPPLGNIPSGDWFCFDCISKATGRRHCFVCGSSTPAQCQATKVGGSPNEGTTTMGVQPSRLLVCDGCSRALHVGCSRQLLTRLPKRWRCSACQSQTGGAVKGATVASCGASKSLPAEWVAGDNSLSSAGSCNSTQTANRCPTKQAADAGNTKTSEKSTKKQKRDSSLTQRSKASANSAAGSISSGDNVSKETTTSSSSKRLSHVNRLLNKSKQNMRANLANKAKQAVAIGSASPSNGGASGSSSKPGGKPLVRRKLSATGHLKTAGPRGGIDSKLEFPIRPKPLSDISCYNFSEEPSTPPSVDEMHMSSCDHPPKSMGELSDGVSVVSSGHGSSAELSSQHDSMTSKTPLGSEELRWCRLATEDMMRHASSWAFRKPVSSKQVPFYRKVIKRPMDLSKILRKLRNPCEYTTFEAWVNDVRLIFDNCEVFNEDDCEVGRAGHLMRAYFESNWAVLPTSNAGTTDRYEGDAEDKPMSLPPQSAGDEVMMAAEVSSHHLSASGNPAEITQVGADVSDCGVEESRLSPITNSGMPNQEEESVTEQIGVDLKASNSDENEPLVENDDVQLPSEDNGRHSPITSIYSDSLASTFSGFEQSECADVPIAVDPSVIGDREQQLRDEAISEAALRVSLSSPDDE